MYQVRSEPRCDVAHLCVGPVRHAFLFHSVVGVHETLSIARLRERELADFSQWCMRLIAAIAFCQLPDRIPAAEFRVKFPLAGTRA